MVTGIPRGTTADYGGPGGSGGTGTRSRPGRGITLGALSAALIWVPARLAAGAG
jgi:hypothetical protein